MGASRYLVGFVCLGLVSGCVESASSDIAGDALNLEYDVAGGPDLPAAPAGAECVLIQRGTLGQVQDTDIGYGNGEDWAAGAYPFTWTGPSPYNHWSLYRFDLSVVPANSTIVLGVFSNYRSWNELHSTVRAHALTKAWGEATSTWANFTDSGAVTGWDPGVVGTLDPEGVGFQSLEITGLVQDWYSGAVTNNGLVLEEDPVKLHTYFASEASTVSMRPSLYVCYVAGVVDPGPECTEAAGACGDNEDCCDGLSCIGGECATPGGQVCAADGAACDLNTPCCNAESFCDGTCFAPLDPNGGNGGGGDACFPIAAACGDSSQCCTGSCLDGLCTALNVPNTCVQPDQADAEGNQVMCDPSNPCCAGSHCIWGLCQPDEFLEGGTCSIKGESCDPDNGSWCCWSMWCMGDGTCQPAP